MEDIVLPIVVYLVFTIVGGIIASKFKQPSIMGLLLMGVLIGPHAFNLSGGVKITDIVIQLGSVLLLFLIGLEFSLHKMKNIGPKAFIIAILKVGFIIFFVFQLGLLLNFNTATSLVLGIILAFSSTVVVVKVIEQKSLINRQEIPLLVAVLIVEDILVVFFLAFFSSITGGSLAASLQKALLSLAVMVVIYLILHKYLGTVISWAMRNSNDDVIPYVGLGLCGGLSYLAHALGLSPTIGAFLAGSIIASLPQKKNFAAATTPYTMMVTSMFFIAMGTLVDTHMIIMNMWLIVTLLVAAIIIRYLAISFITAIVANFRSEQAAFFSVAMFSIGEFSMLIAQQTKGIIQIDGVSIAAAVVFISSFLMMFALPACEKISAYTDTKMPRHFQRRIHRLSGTIKALLEGLDTDSRPSSLFKKKLGQSALLGFSALIVASALFIGLRWLGTQGLLRDLSSLVIVILTVFILYKAYKRLQQAIECLAVVYSNIQSKQLYQARGLLNTLTGAFVIIVVTLFMPFVMYALDMPGWTIIFAYMFLILGMLMLSKVMYRINIGITYVSQTRYFRE
ncbi:MAG: cation:proton antiporter [Nanoarchaeota archaeon]